MTESKYDDEILDKWEEEKNEEIRSVIEEESSRFQEIARNPARSMIEDQSKSISRNEELMRETDKAIESLLEEVDSILADDRAFHEDYTLSVELPMTRIGQSVVLKLNGDSTLSSLQTLANSLRAERLDLFVRRNKRGRINKILINNSAVTGLRFYTAKELPDECLLYTRASRIHKELPLVS